MSAMLIESVHEPNWQQRNQTCKLYKTCHLNPKSYMYTESDIGTLVTMH